jgi:hypothetical protein
MAIIRKTTLGTSDPIDICDGLALFKSGTPREARALQLGFHSTRTLLKTNPQVLAWRFNVDAGYTVFAGVCGPAYALRFDVEGETTGDKISLKVTNDETAAGFMFGITAELFLNFSIDSLAIRFIADGWNSRFAEEWGTVLSTRVSVSLDLVEILRDFLLKLFGARPDQKNTKLEKQKKTLPERVASWGMYDYQKGSFAANNGSFQVNPSFSIPINLVALTKTLPPPLNALYLADQALQKFWGGAELGPRFTVSVPVSVKLTAITVMDAVYENITFKDGMLTGTGGREIANPRAMAASLSEQPGFDIQLEFYISISVCKLFSLDASVPLVNITGLLGIKIAPGPFSHVVGSDIGGGPSNLRHAVHDERTAAAPIEVILEDPAEAFA